MEGAQNHLVCYIKQSFMYPKEKEWGFYSGRGPLKTVIIPFILKTKLRLILQAEAQKCLFTKMVGAYTLRDAQKCWTLIFDDEIKRNLKLG